MSKQYYLVSQLPSVENLDSRQLPITEQYYRDLCGRFLDAKSVKIIQNLSLEPPKKEGKTGSAFLDKWNEKERCLRFEERKQPEERLTENEILRNIRRIDRGRKQVREVLTGRSASDGSTFDLTVNSTHWEIKKLAEAVAEFSGRWFEQR